VENHAEKAVVYSDPWRLYAELIAVAFQASVVLILLILLGELAGAKSLHAHITHEAVLIK
jgi:chaperone required for assembly of F1-ATPase